MMRTEVHLKEYFSSFAPDRVYDTRKHPPLEIPDGVSLVVEEGGNGLRMFGLRSSKGETLWINRAGEKVQSISLFRDIEGRVFLVCRVTGQDCYDRLFLIKKSGEVHDLSPLWKGLPHTKRVACYLELFRYLRAEADGVSPSGFPQQRGVQGEGKARRFVLF